MVPMYYRSVIHSWFCMEAECGLTVIEWYSWLMQKNRSVGTVVLMSVVVQKSRRNSLLKRKKKSGASMKLKTLGIKVVDDTFKVSNIAIDVFR